VVWVALDFKETSITSHSALLTNERLNKIFELLDENLIKMLTFHNLENTRVCFACLLDLFSYLATTELPNEIENLLLKKLSETREKIKNLELVDKVNLKDVLALEEDILDLNFAIKKEFQALHYFFRIVLPKETLFEIMRKKFRSAQNEFADLQSNKNSS